jgi:hypothetical protein
MWLKARLNGQSLKTANYISYYANKKLVREQEDTVLPLDMPF